MKMDVRHLYMTWFFTFKLSLLLIEVIEASRNIEESNLDLNDRVSKIEAKDRHQDEEIALLNNAFERKLVHDLTNRIAVLENSNKISGRPKRPVRLLPPNILRGPAYDKMDADENSFQFYGPATGCNDLSKLGYTLNGFYLVQEKEDKSVNSRNSNNRQIEIVECRFRKKTNSGKQTADDKERRLGFIHFTDGKKADDKEKELGFERINGGNNSNNIHPYRFDVKGEFDLKKVDDKENGKKFTTSTNTVISISTTQPRFEVKRECLYKLKSEAHKFAMPNKLMNMCLVAAERKSKNIGSTNEPEYYLGQSQCDSLNADEEHWTRRNNHICSSKNEYMCLTVSPNIKDGGVLINLMAYEESAKSQQWIVKATEGKLLVMNAGTSLCLFEPMDNDGKTRKANTTVKTCPAKYAFLEYLFYFEQVKSMNRKKCSPF